MDTPAFCGRDGGSCILLACRVDCGDGEWCYLALGTEAYGHDNCGRGIMTWRRICFFVALLTFAVAHGPTVFSTCAPCTEVDRTHRAAGAAQAVDVVHATLGSANLNHVLPCNPRALRVLFVSFLVVLFSLAELSMLLNPGRAAKCNPDPVRSSGGFTGLVRHVIELSAVGELPLALDAEMIEGADEPVGCTIEYSLPSGQVISRRQDRWGCSSA